MSDESYLLEKKEKNWLSRILKLVFILSACGLVGITVLSNMGGSNDSLKGSVEGFVSGLFQGRPTTVGKLVHMGFFPRMGFDAEKITVLSKPENGYAIAKIGKVQAFMGFWNVATSTSKMSYFYLENFEAVKGVFGPKEFSVEKIFIDHDAENATAKLRGNGKIGLHAWSFIADIDVSGSKGKYGYSFRRDTPIIADLGDIHFEGTFIRHVSDYYKLQDFKISSGNKTLGGNLILSALGEKLLKLKGRVTSSGEQTVLLPDVIFDFGQSPVKVSGNLASDSLILNDIIGDGSMSSIFMRLREIIGYSGIHEPVEGQVFSFGRYNLDVNVDLNNVKINDTVVKALKFPIMLEGDNVKIGPVQTETDVMPPVLLVMQKETGTVLSILQNGALNLSALKGWMPDLSKAFSEYDNLDVECGIAVFKRDDSGFMIQNFDINTAQGSVGVRNKHMMRDENINDLQFFLNSEKSELKVQTLKNKSYDFVQSSLQHSTVISPCSSSINQVQAIKAQK